MLLRLGTLTALACLAGATAMPALASGSGLRVCEADTLLLRNTVIVDASGRWDDQDILIERGEISAIGPDITYQGDTSVVELDTAGGIVRPRRDETVRLFVRTSTASRSPAGDADYIMPGRVADFTLYAADAGESRVRLQIENGRISTTEPACTPG